MSFDHDQWRRDSARAYEDRMRSEHRYPVRRIGRNRGRMKRLRAEQFGDDGYREEILSTPCLVCGVLPVDPAHVLKTRAAGGGPEGLAPLCRQHHRAFDSMGAERFEAVEGVSKADIRAWAKGNWAEWRARADG